MTFHRDQLRTTPTGDGTAVWDCPAGFQQGRGAWGGLPVGAFLDAAISYVADPALEPRSLTAHLLGPVPPGPAEIRLTMLRRGSNTATLSALMIGQEADRDGAPAGDPVVLADAVIVFGSARVPDLDFTDPVWHPQAPPAAVAAGWESVPTITLPAGAGPDFLAHLEVRPVSGFPFSGSADSETLGWVRPPGGLVGDAPELACLADAWWPSCLLPIAGFRPAATLAFSLDLASLPSGDAPLLHRGRLHATREGYAVETRELWSADGRLCSLNQQTMVIIR